MTASPNQPPFQFSLGNLFWLMTLIAVLLGCLFCLDPLYWVVLSLWLGFIAFTVAVFFVVLGVLHVAKAMFVDPLRTHERAAPRSADSRQRSASCHLEFGRDDPSGP